jgi:hypothetical protein
MAAENAENAENGFHRRDAEKAEWNGAHESQSVKSKNPEFELTAATRAQRRLGALRDSAVKYSVLRVFRVLRGHPTLSQE